MIDEISNFVNFLLEATSNQGKEVGKREKDIIYYNNLLHSTTTRNRRRGNRESQLEIGRWVRDFGSNDPSMKSVLVLGSEAQLNCV